MDVYRDRIYIVLGTNAAKCTGPNTFVAKLHRPIQIEEYYSWALFDISYPKTCTITGVELDGIETKINATGYAQTSDYDKNITEEHFIVPKWLPLLAYTTDTIRFKINTTPDSPKPENVVLTLVFKRFPMADKNAKAG